MDITDNQAKIAEQGKQRINERLVGAYSPPTKARATMYLAWLDKQARQRQKTLEMDGVTHSRDMKDFLRHEKKAYQEEYKRVKDAITDGEIK